MSLVVVVVGSLGNSVGKSPPSEDVVSVASALPVVEVGSVGKRGGNRPPEFVSLVALGVLSSVLVVGSRIGSKVGKSPVADSVGSAVAVESVSVGSAVSDELGFKMPERRSPRPLELDVSSAELDTDSVALDEGVGVVAFDEGVTIPVGAMRICEDVSDSVVVSDDSRPRSREGKRVNPGP